MMRINSVTLCLLLTFACLAVLPPAFSEPEDWQDTQGTKFFGEPTELLGPFAVFRTSRDTGRRVALHLLAPQDCVRVYRGLENKPARADKWTNATGEATRELNRRLLKVEGDQLVPVDFAARPEPSVIFVFYVGAGIAESREMLRDASAPFRKLQHDFPGLVEGVMYGMNHTKAEHAALATSEKVPWLVTEFFEQTALDSLSRFLPDSYSIMVLTRDDVPLFSADKPNQEEVTKLFNDVSTFLDLVRPENPKGWSARGYYWSAVQPVLHAHDHADPLLVGNTLVAQGLVQRKVFRFDAEIGVNSEGKVTEVKMMPNDSIPPKMVAPIADALKKAVFVPAVQDGKFVDGVYRYHFQAPPQ